MPARPTVSAAAFGVAFAVGLPLFVPLQLAQAGSWNPVEIRRSAEPSREAAQSVADDKSCVWTRFRGWHRTGRLGTWHACRPGPEWRYERRCWIGPGSVQHCRFYG